MNHMILVTAISVITFAVPPVTSTFDRSADGWTIVDQNCSTYGIVGTGVLTWIATGGNPGGFVRSTDPSSNCYAYAAPTGFLGNRSAYAGGSVCWSIRTNVADWLPGSVFILGSGSLILVADVPQPSTNGWVSYAVPLDASAFKVGSATGAAATPEQLATVLANVTLLRVSAEFGSEAGEETVDLDSVKLSGPCAADLDNSGGVNGADLGILLGDWNTDSLTSDLNCDGIVAGADLGILLGAWGPCL
ncbi:MAG: hypothetical protein JNM94_07690 [Phycisphaerae bacterium]|nr:hypothetical protein [Phycisphaerae bacterium]